MLTAVKLAPVEVYQTEARRLEQRARDLVLLAGHRHADQLGLLSLPLRAPATGVRARHPALWHSHDQALLLVGGSPRKNSRQRQLLLIVAGELLGTKIVATDAPVNGMPVSAGPPPV